MMCEWLEKELRHMFRMNAVSMVITPYPADRVADRVLYYFSDETDDFASAFEQASMWCRYELEELFTEEEDSDGADDEQVEEAINYLERKRWYKLRNWINFKLENGLNSNWYDDMMEEQEYFIL